MSALTKLLGKDDLLIQKIKQLAPGFDKAKNEFASAKKAYTEGIHSPMDAFTGEELMKRKKSYTNKFADSKKAQNDYEALLAKLNDEEEGFSF